MGGRREDGSGKHCGGVRVCNAEGGTSGPHTHTHIVAAVGLEVGRLPVLPEGGRAGVGAGALDPEVPRRHSAGEVQVDGEVGAAAGGEDGPDVLGEDDAPRGRHRVAGPGAVDDLVDERVEDGAVVRGGDDAADLEGEDLGDGVAVRHVRVGALVVVEGGGVGLAGGGRDAAVAGGVVAVAGAGGKVGQDVERVDQGPRRDVGARKDAGRARALCNRAPVPVPREGQQPGLDLAQLALDIVADALVVVLDDAVVGVVLGNPICDERVRNAPGGVSGEAAVVVEGDAAGGEGERWEGDGRVVRVGRNVCVCQGPSTPLYNAPVGELALGRCVVEDLAVADVPEPLGVEGGHVEVVDGDLRGQLRVAEPARRGRGGRGKEAWGTG
jgi:hypothetical protein